MCMLKVSLKRYLCVHRLTRWDIDGVKGLCMYMYIYRLGSI